MSTLYRGLLSPHKYLTIDVVATKYSEADIFIRSTEQIKIQNRTVGWIESVTRAFL